MSIRTKIDFSGITSDNIVTSDNKKYIHEDDEIFNSLKDEIAACENAQVQTEIATLQILEIKEDFKEITNEAIDTATERAESAAQNAESAAQNAEEIREDIRIIVNEAIDTSTERAENAAQNAETAQALAETAAINALEAERNVTEFSESFAKLDEDNTFTGNNNFTGQLTVNDENVVIVSKQVQGTSTWYTHLSSGLLIQSGEYIFNDGNITSDEITLTRPYDTPYYTVLVILDGDTSNDGNGMLSIVSKTTTSFKIHNGQAKTGLYRWIAIGFSSDFS